MFEIMNDLEIEINSKKIRIKEYKGYRVVTFADIDAVHGRPEGTAKRNFNKNMERFIEGEDYFVVKPTDSRKYEIRTSEFEVNNRGTILLTESGYLMLVKSFTDELSWTVQRQLVKSYFRVGEITKSDNNLSVQVIEKLELIEQNQKRIDQKINALEQKIDSHEKNSKTRADNIIKILFDMAKDVIANGFETLHKNLFK